MKLLVYDWLKDLAQENIERPTQKYEHFCLFNTEGGLIKYILVPDDCKIIKYRRKNKWKLIYEESDFPKFPNLKLKEYTGRAYELAPAEGLNWIGNLRIDSSTFFINPYFKNQNTINLVISKIRGI